MDEIFGRENFIANVVWQKRYVSNVTARFLSDMHDHILIYAKRAEGFSVSRLPRTSEQEADYKNHDNDPRGPWRAQDLSASKPYSAGLFTIQGPNGDDFDPPPKRFWRMNREQYEKWLTEGRISFGKSGKGRPMLKRFLSEAQDGLTPNTWWNYNFAGHNKEATLELKEIFAGDPPFDTPKPVRLLERILQIATKPGDLILDSFAGSGTTGHAVLKLNHTAPGQEPRRFILVEMEPKIAREVTTERVRRVAEGYTNAKGEHVEGLGGSFRFCELGEPLFDEDGKIRETVSFADLARHVYFTETGEPLPRERVTKSPFLGVCRGVGIYLLYNGILGDRSANGGNILTRAVFGQLPPFDGPKVVYCAGSLLGHDRLQAERLIIRQIPYEIKVS